MAPQVSLADDVAELSRAVAQLGRLLVVKGVPAGQRNESAAAAGMGLALAADFAAGLEALPPRQGIAYINSILERKRLADANFAMAMRQPHAGSDIMRGKPESTVENLQASLDALHKDFPAWTIGLPAGHEDLRDGGGARLVWKATHGTWADCYGGAAHELRTKIAAAESKMKADAENTKRYLDGRGVRNGKILREF